MAAPTVTALPTAPVRNVADPDTYVDIADAWAVALPTFGAEVQAAGEYANTKALAAASSATTATGAATTATGAAATATTKAGEASDSAALAASNAAGWLATSSSSMALTAGSKSITVSTGKLFSAGTNIKIKRTSDPLVSYAFATVSTYNSSTGAMTFTLAVGDITGTGTFTDWTIELSGAKGAAGVGDLIAANNLSDVPNKPTARTNLGLAIGTDVQAYNANLAALAGLTGASNKLAYFTGASALALTDLSAFGRSLIDDADASAARTTLGLGTAATLNHGTSAGDLVRLDPSTGKLPAVDGSLLTNIAAAGGFSNSVLITYTQSFSFQAGKTYLIWGKGGGGGGGYSSSGRIGSDTVYLGGGAGAEWFGTYTPSSSHTGTMTIGAGGARGENASNGGQTQIGTTDGNIDLPGGYGGVYRSYDTSPTYPDYPATPGGDAPTNGIGSRAVGVGRRGESAPPALFMNVGGNKLYSTAGGGIGAGSAGFANPTSNSGAGGNPGSSATSGAAGFIFIAW